MMRSAKTKIATKAMMRPGERGSARGMDCDEVSSCAKFALLDSSLKPAGDALRSAASERAGTEARSLVP